MEGIEGPEPAGRNQRIAQAALRRKSKTAALPGETGHQSRNEAETPEI
jgi:hypothetical protein